MPPMSAKVKFLAPMQAEKLAYALARYSRSCGPGGGEPGVGGGALGREVLGDLLLRLWARLDRGPRPRRCRASRRVVGAGSPRSARRAVVGRSSAVDALSGFLGRRPHSRRRSSCRLTSIRKLDYRASPSRGLDRRLTSRSTPHCIAKWLERAAHPKPDDMKAGEVPPERCRASLRHGAVSPATLDPDERGSGHLDPDARAAGVPPAGVGPGGGAGDWPAGLDRRLPRSEPLGGGKRRSAPTLARHASALRSSPGLLASERARSIVARAASPTARPPDRAGTTLSSSSSGSPPVELLTTPPLRERLGRTWEHDSCGRSSDWRS